VTQLERQGIRAINPPMAFPMETDPSRKNPWVVSHKPVAVAAGMGMMGLHRNVIHPKFGNFILLATVLVGAPVDHYNQPIDYNPCMSCKLCVAVCPVGAIAPDGHFDSTACYTHNYREFQANFGDWVETIADSKNGLDYRRKVTRSETVSMWQSLSFGTSYKSGYCLAVCPAGEDVIGLFNENRPAYVKEVVKPLQEKEEAVYVVPNTDAETYLKRHFPKKTVRHVRSSTTPMTIAGFIAGTKIGFQRHHSEGLNATFHFTFTGKESQTATIVIQNKTIDVQAGHQGTAQLHVTADSQTWLGFLAKERSLLWALLKRKIKISGSPKLLVAFGKCFPS
jgi:ferredoxin